MQTAVDNPFSETDDRDLWEILVRHDVEGFLGQDWSVVAGDFLAEGFVGWDARFTSDTDQWRITFPTLEAYRQAWMSQSQEFARTRYQEDPRERLYAAMRLSRIEISGDTALVHKRFDGSILREDGDRLVLRWQSLFVCRRTSGHWKVAGFIGYLPDPLVTGDGPGKGVRG